MSTFTRGRLTFDLVEDGPADGPPVVLLHGTDSSAYADFSGLAPTLAGQGFCVYAINYGGAVGATTLGTEDIRLGAPAVRAFVDQVRAWTGADRVDVVGYSQGATVGGTW